MALGGNSRKQPGQRRPRGDGAINFRKSQAGYDLHDCPSAREGQPGAMLRATRRHRSDRCPFRSPHPRRSRKAARPCRCSDPLDPGATNARQAGASCRCTRHPVFLIITLDASPIRRVASGPRTRPTWAGGPVAGPPRGPADDDPRVQGAGGPGGDRLGDGPSPNAMGPDEVPDDSLMYVRLTRAVDHLAMTWIRAERVHRPDPPGVEGPGSSELADPPGLPEGGLRRLALGRPSC
jgi:hypothetical protein